MVFARSNGAAGCDWEPTAAGAIGYANSQTVHPTEAKPNQSFNEAESLAASRFVLSEQKIEQYEQAIVFVGSRGAEQPNSQLMFLQTEESSNS